MRYTFLDQGDERLLELAALPQENGRVIAMRTTGYAFSGDEIVELAISDLDGNNLFCKRVKPQNIEEWQPSEASGGISPADVTDEQELFQYEDEIIALFEDVDMVVCEHLAFVKALIESSWITLPDFEGFDLAEEFRLAHSTSDYPGQPATATSLADICAYYDIELKNGSTADEAATVAACYRSLITEHIRERDAKGTAYWEDYERRLAEEAAKDEGANAVARLREHRLNQMNGLLWIAGAIIFTSLVIQLYQNGSDMGFMVIAGAVAVFCLIRGIANFRK